ncbi:hypothetical protein [Ascidiaceihabitans sp.]|uniref:hypothetical protein n=1 Tax=Ascidiaceihabitans sp. TaxID=1872644 RepID=UPI003299122F
MYHISNKMLAHQAEEIPIADFEKEYAFAGDKNAQFQLIKDAFRSGDEQKFEQALRTVLDARDSLRRGILDMLRDAD